MSQSKFQILHAVSVKKACVLTNLQGVTNLYELDEGMPRAGSFPNDATFSMHPDWPNDTLLIDAYETRYDLTVISPAFSDFLQSLHIPDLEFLPVTILNHQDRPSAEYFILHPVHSIDCLDIDASNAEFDTMDEDRVEELDELVLFETNVPEERSVFRVGGLAGALFFERNLATRITEKKFVGFDFIELSAFSV